MNMFPNQRDPKRFRFSLPDDVWKWELKPLGFAILTYLCYRHVHCKKDVSPPLPHDCRIGAPYRVHCDETHHEVGGQKVHHYREHLIH